MGNVVYFDWNLDSEHPLICQNIALYSHMAQPELDMHPALHLSIIKSGIHNGCCRDKIFFVSTGEIFLTAPWEPHCSLRSETEMLLITLDNEALWNFFHNCREKLECIYAMNANDRLEFLNHIPERDEYVKRFNDLALLPDSGEKNLRLWHTVLGLILAYPQPEINKTGYTDSDRLQPALKMMGNRLLPVETAARVCGLSPSRFAAVFKSTFGLSYSCYERNFRLNGAADALRRGSTLKEAADEWDFCDKSHLSRLLKLRKKS